MHKSNSARSIKETLVAIIGAIVFVACSASAGGNQDPSDSFSIVRLNVVDDAGDVSIEISKGDESAFGGPNGAIDLISVDLEVSPQGLTVGFTMADAPAYVAPTVFGPTSSLDQVYSYFVYLETDNDGVFDYRLMATNNYDTGKWEGEFLANSGQVIGGTEFPGKVEVRGNSLVVTFDDPFVNILGENWAVCPAIELSYDSVANEIPSGGDLADFSGWAIYTDEIQGIDGAPRCLSGFTAPFLINRSEVVPN